MSGIRMTQTQLARAVEGCMGDVMAARLDSHGLKLGHICKLILKAYLADICTQMAQKIEELAEKYDIPSDATLETIRKLTKAFEMAKAANIPPPPESDKTESD